MGFPAVHRIGFFTVTITHEKVKNINQIQPINALLKKILVSKKY